MENCICVKIPKGTSFEKNEEYYYNYTKNGIKLFQKNSIPITIDEITFLFNFKTKGV